MNEIALEYTIRTDFIDDFAEEEFLELLRRLESIGCTVK